MKLKAAGPEPEFRSRRLQEASSRRRIAYERLLLEATSDNPTLFCPPRRGGGRLGLG